jgi:cell division initiation protein
MLGTPDDPKEGAPMTSTELDLPLLPSSDQIRRREFATIRRGYDPEQVREYLTHIAVQVETLEGELREARLRSGEGERVVQMPEPQPTEDPYERFASTVSDVLRAADEHAAEVLHQASEEASRVLAEARSEADRIRVDAQARAEEARQQGSEILTHAKVESERVLSSLSARRETLVEQLAQMQSRLLGVARDLEAAIDDPATNASDPVGSDEAPDALDSAMPVAEPGVDEPPREHAGGDEPFEDDAPLDPRYEDLWVARETVELDLDDLDLGGGEQKHKD